MRYEVLQQRCHPFFSSLLRHHLPFTIYFMQFQTECCFIPSGSVPYCATYRRDKMPYKKMKIINKHFVWQKQDEKEKIIEPATPRLDRLWLYNVYVHCTELIHACIYASMLFQPKMLLSTLMRCEIVFEILLFVPQIAYLALCVAFLISIQQHVNVYHACRVFICYVHSKMLV